MHPHLILRGVKAVRQTVYGVLISGLLRVPQVDIDGPAAGLVPGVSAVGVLFSPPPQAPKVTESSRTATSKSSDFRISFLLAGPLASSVNSTSVQGLRANDSSPCGWVKGLRTRSSLDSPPSSYSRIAGYP